MVFKKSKCVYTLTGKGKLILKETKEGIRFNTVMFWAESKEKRVINHTTESGRKCIRMVWLW